MRTHEVAQLIEHSMWRYGCGLKTIALLDLDSDLGELGELWIVNIGSLSRTPDELQVEESQRLAPEIMRQVHLILPQPDPYATLVYMFRTGAFNLEYDGSEEKCEEVIEKILALIPTTYLNAVIDRHQKALCEMTFTTPDQWNFHS